VLDEQPGRTSAGECQRILDERVGRNFVHRNVGDLVPEPVHDLDRERASWQSLAHTAH